MTRRMWVLVTAAWVAVVIAGSAMVWAVIDRAGLQVTSAATPSLPPVASTSPPPVGGVSSAAPATATAPAPTPSPTPRPTSPPPASPRHGPLASPTPIAPSSPSAPPVVSTEIRTWSGASGSVTASCTGTDLRLLGASPTAGWRVELGNDSGTSAEVTFISASTEVQVQVTCSGGVPQFTSETSARD